MLAMSKSFVCVCLLLVVGSAVGFKLKAPQASGSESTDKLEVTVYYETLCTDSMRFFNRQLIKSMVDKNRLPYTKLTFVPYGKVIETKVPGTNESNLDCQHGPNECELNALHACIIETNDDELDTLLLINCLMSGFNTDIDECAAKYHQNVDEAKACKAARSTPQILKKYGEQTSKIDISFVPSIGMDYTINYDEQYQLRQNFDSVFCRKFTEKFNYSLGGCPELSKLRRA